MKVSSMDSTLSMANFQSTDSRRGRMAEATENFEALFIQQMLKSMRKTVPEDGLLSGGNAEKIYQEMLDEKYAEVMASQKFGGIAESLQKQLGKKLFQDSTSPKEISNGQSLPGIKVET